MIFSASAKHWKRVWQSAMLPGVVGTGIRAGAQLLLLPLLLKLSNADLALWYRFAALGAVANLADFGFGMNIPRIYSYLYAGAEDFEAEGLRPAKEGGKPNLAGISRINITVQSLYVKISLAAVGLLAIAGSIYLMKSVAHSGSPQKAWLLWALFIVAIGYNLATFHWVLAVQGLNRMRDLQVALIWGGLSFAGCAALLLVCHMGLASMVIATFTKGVVLHGRCRQIFRQIVSDPEPGVKPDLHIVLKLWPNSFKVFISSIGSYCINNGSLLICGQLLSDEITVSFGVTAQIGNFMTSCAALWLDVKWPEISIMRAQKRLEQMAVLFARRLALVMLSFFGMALVMLVWGNVLLAWMSTQKRLLAAPYLAFYLFYLAQRIFYSQFATLAHTENVVPFFKITFWTGLGVVLCSLMLTPLLGLWGLVTAPFIVEMAYSSWFVVKRGFQNQPLSVREFCRAMA
jgi:O-antigen/teichoic acid export membrane protein